MKHRKLTPNILPRKKFNELLKKKTNGELTLKLFPDSTLGNAQAMISGVRGGTIDMEMSGSNNFTGLAPVFNLLDVPFLFRDTAHAHKTLDGKVGDELKKSLDSKGLKVLAYWENGWRDVTNSRAPVKTPGDLKGLKIRTNNSPMNIAAFKIFGANPIPMPFSEVYTGLETRTIDARNTLSTSCGQRNSMRYRNTSPSLITPIRLCCW